jgi:Na+/melibiose symporter-like transporter
VLGPALAGFLLASPFGATGAYAVMSALYVVAALSLAPLPRSRARTNASETHVLADLRDGLRYVASHRRLRLLVLFFVSVIMTGFSYVTVLPGLVEHALQRSAEAVPPLFFTSALGGLAVTLATARVADTSRALPLFVAMPFVFAADCSPCRERPRTRSASGPCSWWAWGSAASRR